MSPRTLCGATFGSPGPDRAQGATDGSKWMVWSHFRASWPGSGPGSHRWLQMDGLEPLSGLLAQIGSKEPQMALNVYCGATFGPPGPDRAQGATDGSKWKVWNHFAAPRPDRPQRAADDLPIVFRFYTAGKLVCKVV